MDNWTAGQAGHSSQPELNRAGQDIGSGVADVALFIMNCLTWVWVCLCVSVWVCGSATPPCALSIHLIVTLIGSGHSILISFRNGSRAASAIVGSCCLQPAACCLLPAWIIMPSVIYFIKHTSACVCVCVWGVGGGVASWNYATANIYDAAAAKAVEFNWVALRHWQCGIQRIAAANERSSNSFVNALWAW